MARTSSASGQESAARCRGFTVVSPNASGPRWHPDFLNAAAPGLVHINDRSLFIEDGDQVLEERKDGTLQDLTLTERGFGSLLLHESNSNVSHQFPFCEMFFYEDAPREENNRNQDDRKTK